MSAPKKTHNYGSNFNICVGYSDRIIRHNEDTIKINQLKEYINRKKVSEPVKEDVIVNSIPNEIEEDIYNKKTWIIQSKMNFKFMSKPKWFLNTIRQGTIFPIRLIPEEKFNDIWDLIESDDRIEVKDGLLIGLNKNQVSEVRKKRRI